MLLITHVLQNVIHLVLSLACLLHGEQELFILIQEQGEQTIIGAANGVIVAGGGGASGGWGGSYQTTGGAGGGLTGRDCISVSGSSQSLGLGASIIAAGANFGGTAGGFGFGAYTSSGSSSGGGGSGWYGGGAGRSNGSGGGGGSGWVYNADNYDIWQSGNPTDASNWGLDSSYYLTNAETIDGETVFLDPDGTEVIGHSGNGYARITWVSN